MRIALLTAFLHGLLNAQSSDGREQGRSMTIATNGIVATSQILASQAGADMLARGGSAVDAAIAANAVLGLVEPMMSGLGGDLFAIVWTAKDGKLHGLNASGWAPEKLTIDFLKSKQATRMPIDGIHTVTVPGAVAGWAALHKRFGKLSWRTLFEPAIRHAAAGFPVSERMASAWNRPSVFKALQRTEAAPEIFLPAGKPPGVGQMFRNPALAKAYLIVAGQGPESFYRGTIAKAILETSRKLGGTMESVDLTEWAPEWVEPISTTYRGWTVYELPPNGSGIGALEMLNVMETEEFSKRAARSPDALHWGIESMRVAWADLWRFVSDPRFVSVPVKPMLSKDYARRRAGGIDRTRANCAVAASEELISSGNTTYLAAVDSEGNIVSWIQSLATAFGSFVNVEGMGFHLQNRGAYFRLDPKHANALASRKRPFHTIIPAFMEKGSEKIGFGIMGGPTQPYSHAQFVSNIADYGMNLQAAMDEPRYSPGSGCAVTVESRVPTASRDELVKRGHKVNVVSSFVTTGVGVGQAVMRDVASQVNFGASDARGDGAAIPQSVLVAK